MQNRFAVVISRGPPTRLHWQDHSDKNRIWAQIRPTIPAYINNWLCGKSQTSIRHTVLPWPTPLCILNTKMSIDGTIGHFWDGKKTLNSHPPVTTHSVTVTNTSVLWCFHLCRHCRSGTEFFIYLQGADSKSESDSNTDVEMPTYPHEDAAKLAYDKSEETYRLWDEYYKTHALQKTQSVLNVTQGIQRAGYLT